MVAVDVATARTHMCRQGPCGASRTRTVCCCSSGRGGSGVCTSDMRLSLLQPPPFCRPGSWRCDAARLPSYQNDRHACHSHGTARLTHLREHAFAVSQCTRDQITSTWATLSRTCMCPRDEQGVARMHVQHKSGLFLRETTRHVRNVPWRYASPDNEDIHSAARCRRVDVAVAAPYFCSNDPHAREADPGQHARTEQSTHWRCCARTRQCHGCKEDYVTRSDQW